MFTWNFPYPSQRMPVLAKNIVATSQPLAAQAGISMLEKGGNAVIQLRWLTPGDGTYVTIPASRLTP